MLSTSDLDVFTALVRRAQQELEHQAGIHPSSSLSGDTSSDDVLHRAECFRLWKSLKIGVAAGDVPTEYPGILRTIIDALPSDQRPCIPLANATEWMNAIRWGESQQVPVPPSVQKILEDDRESRVGAACARLRHHGYCIPIGAHGPDPSTSTREGITTDLDALIAQCGGLNVLAALCAFMGQAHKNHNGMWLFGTGPTTTGRSPDPAVPVAWLVSLALRHVDAAPQADVSPAIWTKSIALATDFAASMDCQRYSHFEDLHAEPHDFIRLLGESLAWRELFTLPQVPPSTLGTILSALLEAPWPNGSYGVRRIVAAGFREADSLIAGLSGNAITEIPERLARARFPVLWRHALGRRGRVNRGYIDPFGNVGRNHERFVFFEAGGGRVILLTPAMVAANACEALFRLIWAEVGAAASDIVGKTLEKAVVRACRAHTGHVREGLLYEVNGRTLEMDIVVQEQQEVVLFETKAKSLTSESRNGDIVEFIDDYMKSFLALLRQLVRHERHIRSGLIPLDLPSVKSDAVRVTKVAVSPLSYGPVADHALTGILFRAIANARLHSKSHESKHVRILNAFNNRLERTMAEIETVAPRQKGSIDLFSYMHDVFWLDLGETLYVLQRGRSVLGAISALRSLTFGTRDFWTEAAWADRQGFTASKWHDISGP